MCCDCCRAPLFPQVCAVDEAATRKLPWAAQEEQLKAQVKQKDMEADMLRSGNESERDNNAMPRLVTLK